MFHAAISFLNWDFQSYIFISFNFLWNNPNDNLCPTLQGDGIINHIEELIWMIDGDSKKWIIISLLKAIEQK